jgi:hypothetical protein
MHTPEIRQKFVERRAQGWSYARIGTELGVAKSTLVEWSRQLRFELQNRRALELDDLQERLLGPRQHRAAQLGVDFPAFLCGNRDLESDRQWPFGPVLVRFSRKARRTTQIEPAHRQVGAKDRFGCAVDQSGRRKATVGNRKRPFGDVRQQRIVPAVQRINPDTARQRPEADEGLQIVGTGRLSAIHPKNGCWMAARERKGHKDQRLQTSWISPGEVIEPRSRLLTEFLFFVLFALFCGN